MKLKAWLQAARIPSNVNLIFPLLMGQALASLMHQTFSWPIFILVMLFGWFDQLFIVFMNDYADVEADIINKEYNMFSGGSRVVPDRLISRKSLFRSGLLMLGLMTAVGAILTLPFERKASFGFIVAAWFLLWAYSFKPLKMNYHGGGERLQGIGCGALLPVFAYYAQVGSVEKFPWFILIPLYVLHFTSSIATAIPDEAADKRAPKKTIPVKHGIKNAAWAVVVLNIVALCFSAYLMLGEFPLLGSASWYLTVLSLALPALIMLLAMGLISSFPVKSKVQTFDGLVILSGIFYALGVMLHCWL